MSRPLRIDYPGAFHHVTMRGNRKADVFRNLGDRRRFLAILANTCEVYEWICHAYCLMTNHFHLVIETTRPTLSAGMRQLNGWYTQDFNRRHGTVGHVYQGRFKSFLVEKDAYFLELCRYVVLNPVRAGMVAGPEAWSWSNYRATAGHARSPGFLDTKTTLSYFSSHHANAVTQYETFVRGGIGGTSPFVAARGPILGGETFAKKVSESGLVRGPMPEVSRSEKHFGRRTLGEIFSMVGVERSGLGMSARNALIRSARMCDGYGVGEIGMFLGLHYSTVSKIINEPDSHPKT